MRAIQKYLSAAAIAMCCTLPNAHAFVLGPTNPGKWGPGPFGTGATITYSFVGDGVSCAAEFAGCTNTSFNNLFAGLGIAAWTGAVNAAFAAWSAVADVTFVLVPDDGAAFNAATTSGDIRLGAHAIDGPGGTLSHGFFPPVNGVSAAGDIHLDTAEVWKVGFGGTAFDIFQQVAHEIGHALGLDHSPVPASLMNPFYTEAFSGPQADDIAGAVFIYGPAQPRNNVPEPTTMLLMALGLGLLTVRARRRARAD